MHVACSRLLSPYRGFYEDELETRKEIAEVREEGNSTVLEAMYQSLTLKQRFKESLAEKYLKRKLWKLVGNVFVTWRSHVFRFILLRRRLLDTFEFSFLLKRFLSWRKIARRDALLRVMVKRHWRRVRIHAFRKFLRFNKEG
jgi:hypothetical protein